MKAVETVYWREESVIIGVSANDSYKYSDKYYLNLSFS
jgi:hypothetical protein